VDDVLFKKGLGGSGWPRLPKVVREDWGERRWI
jgi:hypothetical protein